MNDIRGELYEADGLTLIGEIGMVLQRLVAQEWRAAESGRNLHEEIKRQRADSKQRG